MRILLMSVDDVRINQIERCLSGAGFYMDLSRHGAQGVARAGRDGVDIILLDPLLPDMGGTEVLRHLREAGINAPVVVVSSEVGVADMPRSCGAAAFITMPTECDVLVACIHHIFGRATEPVFMVEAGRFKMEFTNNSLKVNGERVPLSGVEFQMVRLLAQRRPAIFSNAALLDYLYPGMDEPGMGTVHVLVCRIRNMLMARCGHSFIEAVWGKGYRFAGPPRDETYDASPYANLQ